MKTTGNIKLFTPNFNTIEEFSLVNAIINDSHDTLYFKDKDSKFLLVSKAQIEKLNLQDTSQIIGKSDFDFFPLEHAQAAYNDEQEIIRSGRPKTGKIEKLLWPDGKITWVMASKYPLISKTGEIVGTWGTSIDITSIILSGRKIEKMVRQLKKTNLKIQETNKKLEILSVTDSLSGLYNHRYFYKEVDKEFKRCQRQNEKGSKRTFSVIIFDIDDFKIINDSYGHLAGDFTIKYISKLLKKTIRLTDTAFRFGGDEFVLLLPETDREQSINVADKIISMVRSSPVNYMKKKIFFSISGGISSYNEAKDVNDLISKADKKLYLSKFSGKNQIN
jgi:diguanylate cyclase (GGDEF)-like protein/PAS domain S-box-containing protein